MHKVDSSGSTPTHEFTNGGAGVPRTRLEDKWLNAVQRELCDIVETSGRTLSDTDDWQLVRGLVLCAANVNELRAFKPRSGPATYTAYVGAPGSFCMMYKWDSNSTFADDGNTVIRPNSAPADGRWIWAPPRNSQFANSASQADLALNSNALGGVAAANHLAYRYNIGGSQNLNTFTATGVFYQTLDSQAASGANYPISKAGKLEVFALAGGDVFQTYHLYDNSAFFVRTYYGFSGTWFGWKQMSDVAYVNAAIAALVNSSPGALDTLNELADALGNDPNFATTITNALAAKAPISHTHGASDIAGAFTSNQSLGQTGWARLPGGRIRQWGIINDVYVGGTLGDSATVSFSFPIAFPNAVFQVKFCNAIDPRGGFEAAEVATVWDKPSTTLSGTNSYTRRFGGSNVGSEFISIAWEAEGN